MQIISDKSANSIFNDSFKIARFKKKYAMYNARTAKNFWNETLSTTYQRREIKLSADIALISEKCRIFLQHKNANIPYKYRKTSLQI